MEQLVITHNGVFHSDEVFACALISMLISDIKIIRIRDENIIASFQRDSNVYVLDVGGILDPDFLNFDHHQDKMELSSCGLIFKHLMENHRNSLTRKFYDIIAIEEFNRSVCNPIDSWDNNLDNVIEKVNNIPRAVMTVQSIISSFNYDNVNQDSMQLLQFQRAMDLAKSIIVAKIATANSYSESKEIYKLKSKVYGKVLVCSEYIKFWKRHITGTDIDVAVFKDSPKERYVVLARRAIDRPLQPTELSSLEFIHKDRFIAVFSQYNEAFRYANDYISYYNNNSEQD